MKKKYIGILSMIILIIAGCSSSKNNEAHINNKVTETSIISEYKKPAQYVTVKYRSTQVDVSNFEYLNTSKSSWIRGAWYDKDNEYMIINLEGTNYHYCGLPSYIRSGLKNAESFGSYYNKKIKGNYDCRNGYVPSY